MKSITNLYMHVSVMDFIYLFIKENSVHFLFFLQKFNWILY
jgi:hypothetical protein